LNHVHLQEAAIHFPLGQELYETVRDMVSSASAIMSRPLAPPPGPPQAAAVLRNTLAGLPGQGGFQPPNLTAGGLSGPQNRHSLPPSLFPGKNASMGKIASKWPVDIRCYKTAEQVDFFLCPPFQKSLAFHIR
jgi:hypothetical protein